MKVKPVKELIMSVVGLQARDIILAVAIGPYLEVYE